MDHRTGPIRPIPFCLPFIRRIPNEKYFRHFPPFFSTNWSSIRLGQCGLREREWVCACVWACVRACVCAWDRERDREREIDRERDEGPLLPDYPWDLGRKKYNRSLQKLFFSFRRKKLSQSSAANFFVASISFSFSPLSSLLLLLSLSFSFSLLVYPFWLFLASSSSEN